MKLNLILRSIIWRMRLSLTAIAVSIFGILFVAGLGLNLIEDIQIEYSTIMIPTLTHVEIIQDRLNELDTRLASLRQAALHGKVESEISEAQLLTAEIESAIFDNEIPTQNVRNLNASIDRVTTLGKKIREIFADRDALIAKNDSFGHKLTAQIDSMIGTLGAKLEILTHGGQDNLRSGELQQGILQLNALSELRFLVEKNRDLTSAVLATREGTKLNELSNRLAFQFRSEVRHIVNLSNDPQRLKLAGFIKTARDIVLGEHGFVAAQQRLLAASADLTKEFDVQTRLMDEIGANASASVSDAKMRMLETNALIEKTIDNTIFWTTFIGIVAIALISIIIGYIVEHQIIKRLLQLTVSVRAIAAGDNEYRVPVNGNDELGEMGQALEIFKKNSQELHRSNTELARFAYAASHDLKSPLRAISNLAEWAIEDAGESLPRKSRDKLELLMSRVERLSKLLSSLLDYSRIGREKASVGDIVISDLAKDLTELSGASGCFTIKATANVPLVQTYLAPLRQVLLNLTSNAIKHHDLDKGQITISITKVGDRLNIVFSDDGPGIASDYHVRVFDLFQTLRSRDEIEGSGMGLSIVSKLVEQYGGKITVVSDPKQKRGTSFVFDWPVVADRIEKQRAA